MNPLNTKILKLDFSNFTQLTCHLFTLNKNLGTVYMCNFVFTCILAAVYNRRNKQWLEDFGMHHNVEIMEIIFIPLNQSEGNTEV